jgi:hypothetical protein
MAAGVTAHKSANSLVVIAAVVDCRFIFASPRMFRECSANELTILNYGCRYNNFPTIGMILAVLGLFVKIRFADNGLSSV